MKASRIYGRLQAEAEWDSALILIQFLDHGRATSDSDGR